ncbi:MAG TPA: hypothetical protein DCE76_09740 [Anaerolineaceae bacterium]|nr:hypothetical protein [Anaerolineaceae bacterium]
MINITGKRTFFIGLSLLLLTLCASGIQAAGNGGNLEEATPNTVVLTVSPVVEKFSTPIITRSSPITRFTATARPTKTVTPSSTLRPERIFIPAGQLTVPILLYHRIIDGETTNRYEVSLKSFQDQMEYLSKNGYETITPLELTRVLLKGGDLPPKPIILTFDDGYRSVYEYAFPVLKEHGYSGAVYLITRDVGAPPYLTKEQVIELFANGWEIGSHTVSHEDLIKKPALAHEQLIESKEYLQSLLNVEQLTVAYPYGRADKNIATLAAKYAYSAGMGLGITNNHSTATLYFLSRREITSNCDLNCFEKIVTGQKLEP